MHARGPNLRPLPQTLPFQGRLRHSVTGQPPTQLHLVRGSSPLQGLEYRTSIERGQTVYIE
jgi:hypothetical protein